MRDEIEVPQPQTWEERLELARTCCLRLGLTVPLLLDGMENEADRAYQAWPERLYVIGTDGTILYRGGKGPYGFRPDELEVFLSEYRG